MSVKYFLVGRVLDTENTLEADTVRELAGRAVVVAIGLWQDGIIAAGMPKPVFSAYAEEDGRRRSLTKVEGAALDAAFAQLGAEKLFRFQWRPEDEEGGEA
jgi:hypothetical protein